MTRNETIIAKILFWGLSPLMLAAFLRLFFIIFRFAYGTVLILILGPEFNHLITVVAAMTSLGFAICVIVYIYRQYKHHILGETPGQRPPA